MMVTHDLHAAVFMADKITILQAGSGKVVADILVDLARPREKTMHSDEFYTYEQKIVSLIEKYSPSQNRQM